MISSISKFEKELTGYPSIDKPWLKYYSEEAINAPLPECTIYEYLWENNKDHLDDVALIYFGKKITYKKLFENIDKAANAFLSIGVRKNDIVAMCITNTPESVFCFYALNKIGAIANMLDLRLSANEFLELLNEIDNRYLVLLSNCYLNIKKIISQTKILKAVVMTPFHSLPWPISHKNRFKANDSQFIGYTDFMKLTCNEAIPKIEMSANDTAVIEHTGGTTGVPKGVKISNKSMVCVAHEYKVSGMHMERGEKFLCMVPPFILNGLCTCLNLPLSVGVSTILIPQFEQKDFPKYLKNRPEHIIAAPSWWERLSHDKRMEKVDLSFLITAATGGDGINAENERLLNDFFVQHNSKSILLNGYGMTELGSSVCTGMNHCHELGSIGIPLPQMTLAVFNEENNELKYNECGELCVTGPSIMDGYCGKANMETSDILKTHAVGTKWIHTGDMAHITQDGIVYIDGRIKRIIICEGGFKVFPNIVENVIITIEGVENCAVVGMRVDKTLTGEVPVAFVVSDKSNSNLADIIGEVCEKNLAKHCVPKRCFFISDIPLTSVGKVDYRALEKIAEENEDE